MFIMHILLLGISILDFYICIYIVALWLWNRANDGSMYLTNKHPYYVISLPRWARMLLLQHAIFEK
jgi:hypothetical protein